MRSIVVDIARAKATQRRGANAVACHAGRLSLPAATRRPKSRSFACTRRWKKSLSWNRAWCALYEMRYFVGNERRGEIAAALEVTERTVRRDWQKARILLAAAFALTRRHSADADVRFRSQFSSS